MSAEEITSSVETIEIEAEKTLEEARNRASEIILRAREEAGRILSTEVSLNEVKGERERIISRAEEKANQEIEGAKKKAAEIRNITGKKTGKIAERMVNIITGAEAG